MLVDAGPQWTPWRLDIAPAAAVDGQMIGPERAFSEVEPGGSIRVDRAGQTTTYALSAPSRPEVLIHPLLSFTAVVTSWWAGQHSFHAGAFTLDGGTWGVLGDKGAGKSTLLAALAELGQPIVTDDVLVLRDGLVTAGPRAVDLRTSTVALFPAARPLGSVGSRERWRLELEPVAPESPLRGWLKLDWGPERMENIAPAERLGLLWESLAIRERSPDPAKLLDLAALPSFRWSRQPNAPRLRESAQTLLEQLRIVAGTAGPG